MKVAFVSGLGAVWGTYSPDVLDVDGKGTVGGGEAAMLQTAFGLARRKHKVTVYYPGDPNTYRDVSFLPLPAASIDVANAGFDAVVSWSDPHILRSAPETALRVFSQQLNDLPMSEAFWKAVDVLVSPAQHHLDFLWRTYVPQEWKDATAHVQRAVVPNGVDLALFSGQKLAFNHRPCWVGYWSSPDRGLHHLLRIWPEIRRQVRDAELHVFYHLEKYIRTVLSYPLHIVGPSNLWRAQTLKRLLEDPDVRKGLIIHGPVSRRALRDFQVKTKVMAYPLDPICYTEGFSIACLEGYAAGCLVVARPDDAIEEAHGDAVQWVRGPAASDEFLSQFTDAVAGGLIGQANLFAPAGDRRAQQYTWDNAAEALHQVLLKGKQ